MMAGNHDGQSELLDLVDEMIDGSITAERADRLQQLVSADRTAAKQYVQSMGLSASLHAYAAEASAKRSTNDTMAAQLTANGHAHAGNGNGKTAAASALASLYVIAEADRRRRKTIWMWLRGKGGQTRGDGAAGHEAAQGWRIGPGALVAAAAMLLVAGTLAIVFMSGPSPRPTPQHVATFVRGVDAAFADADADAAIQPGARLAGRSFELTSGIAQFDMTDGSQVLIEAPARFELLAADRVALHDGGLSATVPAKAVGFVVQVPGGQVRDLGTQFTVRVDAATKSTDVFVRAGKVQWLATDDTGAAAPLASLANTRDLSTGEGMRIEPTANGDYMPDEQTELDHASFLSVQEMDRLVQTATVQRAPVAALPLANTGTGLTVGARDPHWTVRMKDIARQSADAAQVLEINEWFLSHDGKSMWLTAPGTVRGDHARYVFETTVDLTGFDHESAVIYGQFLVDDRLVAIRLNGREIAVPDHSRVYDTGHRASLLEYTPFSVVSGFVAGVNTISFEVDNEFDRMGLRVQLSGAARRSASGENGRSP